MDALDYCYRLPIAEFVGEMKRVRYGYKDKGGALHFADEDGVSVSDYVFSMPREILATRCAWCWDMANLIYDYCRYHDYPAFQFFLEYQADGFHTTHTQCFAEIDGLWYAVPDNSSPELWRDTIGYREKDEAIEAFLKDYVAYLRFVLKERFDEKHLFAGSFFDAILREMGDKEYLAFVREAASRQKFSKTMDNLMDL